MMLTLESVPWWIWPLVALYVIAEIAFYVFVCHIHPSVNQATKPAPLGACPIEVMERNFDALDMVPEHMTISTFLSGWFKGAPYESIHFNNVVSFVSWALYGRETHRLSPVEHDALNELVQRVEKRYDVTFPPGINEQLEHCQHTLEECKIFHRPLVFYMFTYTFSYLSNIQLYLMGFRQAVW